MDFETKNLESVNYIQDMMKQINKIIYICIIRMYAFIYRTMY